MILGETGTGKELIARSLHEQSDRADRAFIPVNCGALPENLVESELFGHKAGAFTGASRERVGLVASASGGTLFLDEIGEMPAALQVKLLRVLQEREVTALGSSEPVQGDVRVGAATHRDLRAEVARARFREDLFYRLAVVEIALPPLRERLDDLGWLAPALVERAAASLGKRAPRIAKEAMAALYRHEWPGNVREHENVLTKAMVLADRDVVRAADLELGAPIVRAAARVSRSSHAASEKRRIEAALAANGFNVADACRTLGIPRATMYRKLKRYGIDPSA
jgi:transcriptional regulator with PAS, ATPase and Fis domain